MGEQENSWLTLQGLADRLEALERENERMRSENAELRDEVAALNGSETSQAVEPAFEGRVSRRALLSKAGAAAVVAMAAGMLLNPREAKAHHYQPNLSANTMLTHYLESSANPPVTGQSAAIRGFNTTAGGGTGAVVGQNSGSGPGVRGVGGTGVWGSSSTSGHSGVYGEHRGSSGYGVVGDGTGGSAGVLGRNSGGEGVSGEGKIGVLGVGSDDQQAGVKGEGPTGVWGLSSKIAFSGVYGEHTGTSGIGTTGIGKGGAPGVLGRNSTGVGVLGEGRNGVHGTANGGYGGQFEGGRAQLRLVPTGSVGKPTTGTHQQGEIYVDSAASLFVCTANGTPGTWRKIRTVAV